MGHKRNELFAKRSLAIGNSAFSSSGSLSGLLHGLKKARISPKAIFHLYSPLASMLIKKGFLKYKDAKQNLAKQDKAQGRTGSKIKQQSIKIRQDTAVESKQ